MKRYVRTILTLALCAALITTAVPSLVLADIGTIEGVRWFPVPENRQFDDAWEVECMKDGCLCQRFNETAEDTGRANFLDTVYGDDGSLTITRNGNDQTPGIYWPRIRTISLETAPKFDMKTADTVYFDFTVTPGTTWNVMLSVNGMNVKLSKVISDAAGVRGVANSDADGTAGTYKGSFNFWDALSEISTESGTESSVNAMALQNIKTLFVPQLSIFCVGDVGASITIREFYIATAADVDGDNCTFVDMGLLTGLGDEWYGTQEDPVPTFTRGDVNADGAVDIYDAMRLFKFVNEEIDQEGIDLAACEVNDDGEVDIYDAMRLFKFVNEEIEGL